MFNWKGENITTYGQCGFGYWFIEYTAKDGEEKVIRSSSIKALCAVLGISLTALKRDVKRVDNCY